MVGAIIGYCILGIVVAFIAVMVIRAISAKKPDLGTSEYVPAEIDLAEVAEKLAGAVRIKTVTLPDNDRDGSVFYEYQSYLEATFPLVMSHAEKIQIIT